MMEEVDRAVEWIGSGLSGLPKPFGDLVPLPLMVIVTYAVMAWALRRLLPWLTHQVAGPVAVALIGVLGVVALTGEFIFTQAFRVLRRHPPPLLYAVGDAAMALMIGGQRRARGAARTSRRLQSLHGVLVLAVVVALIYWWNEGYCVRHPVLSRCEAPFSVWSRLARDTWRDWTAG